jgi:hypothetical protein
MRPFRTKERISFGTVDLVHFANQLRFYYLIPKPNAGYTSESTKDKESGSNQLLTECQVGRAR